MCLNRYNNFKEDPLSRCEGCDPPANGENAISARSDLNSANGTYPFGALRQRQHGGTDMKVFVFLIKSLLPPFSVFLSQHINPSWSQLCSVYVCKCGLLTGCLLEQTNCVFPCAADLLRDVSWLRYDSSEWTNVGPGTPVPVEHLPV